METHSNLIVLILDFHHIRINNRNMGTIMHPTIPTIINLRESNVANKVLYFYFLSACRYDTSEHLKALTPPPPITH